MARDTNDDERRTATLRARRAYLRRNQSEQMLAFLA